MRHLGFQASLCVALLRGSSPSSQSARLKPLLADLGANRVSSVLKERGCVSQLLVGVLSDTHGRLSEDAYAELADCDFIIHAGDICGPGIMLELGELAPVCAVLGNNDYPEYGESVGTVATPRIGGVRFLVTHTPTDLRAILSGRTNVLKPGDPVPQVAIHGHTHVPELLRGSAAAPADVVLCPGSVTRPRGGSKRQLAKIAIENGAVKEIRFVELG